MIKKPISRSTVANDEPIARRPKLITGRADPVYSILPFPSMPGSSPISNGVTSMRFDPGVKVADPDVILFDDETLPVELISDLLFENIGGTEILNIARTDLVNGQSVVYSPIKNLSQIALRYNPQNILALQQTTGSVFSSFPLKLANYIPAVGNGPNGSNVYLDPITGDIVVDVVGISRNEQVEIEIANETGIFDDTIYTEET